MKDIKDMNLAEAIKALRDVDVITRGYQCNYDAIVELADRIHDLTRWIPVSERMPTEEDRDVLAWYATKYPFATLVNWYEFPLNNNSVTHWKRITPPETP
jgi:hypothetical protein